MALTLTDVQKIAVAAQPTPGQGLALDLNGKIPSTVRAYLPGFEFAYAESAASGAGDVSVVSTSQASPTPVLSAPAVVLDGQTPIMIEYFAGRGIAPPAVANAFTILSLWRDSTLLGDILNVQANAAGNATVNPAGVIRRKLTPPAGTQTYKIQGYLTAAGTGNVYGRGDAGFLPGYIRVTVA